MECGWRQKILYDPAIKNVDSLFRSTPHLSGYNAADAGDLADRLKKYFKIFGNLDIVKMILNRAIWPETQQLQGNEPKLYQIINLQEHPIIIPRKTSVYFLFGQINLQTQKI